MYNRSIRAARVRFVLLPRVQNGSEATVSATPQRRPNISSMMVRRRLTTFSITDQFCTAGLQPPWLREWSLVALSPKTWLTMNGLDRSEQFRSRV